MGARAAKIWVLKHEELLPDAEAQRTYTETPLRRLHAYCSKTVREHDFATRANCIKLQEDLITNRALAAMIEAREAVISNLRNDVLDIDKAFREYPHDSPPFHYDDRYLENVRR